MKTAMRKIDVGRNLYTLAKKPLLFPATASAPSVQMLIHSSHDNPSFCNVVSTADNMSSPVHVPDSPRTRVTLLQASHWLHI